MLIVKSQQGGCKRSDEATRCKSWAMLDICLFVFGQSQDPENQPGPPRNLEKFKVLPRPICRNVSEDFCCFKFWRLFPGFSWRMFLFPTKKNPRKKSGGTKNKNQQKNPFCQKPTLKSSSTANFGVSPNMTLKVAPKVSFWPEIRGSGGGVPAGFQDPHVLPGNSGWICDPEAENGWKRSLWVRWFQEGVKGVLCRSTWTPFGLPFWAIRFGFRILGVSPAVTLTLGAVTPTFGL